jgi:hypothetical protein
VTPRDLPLSELLEWLGDQFDPDRFDLQKINAELRALEI